MATEAIDVAVFVFPDGTTFWTERTPGFDGRAIGAVMDAWRATLEPGRREQFLAANVCGGCVFMRMLAEDYRRIPATSTSAAIAKGIGSGYQ